MGTISDDLYRAIQEKAQHHNQTVEDYLWSVIGDEETQAEVEEVTVNPLMKIAGTIKGPKDLSSSVKETLHEVFSKKGHSSEPESSD